MDQTIGSDKTIVSPSSNIEKPNAHIQKILDVTAEYSESFLACKGEILRYQQNNKRYCLLLHSGSVELHRRSDGMILNSETAPFIMGVSCQQILPEHLFLRVREDARISRLPMERFNLLIEKYNLWESLAHVLIYTVSRVLEHCTLIVQMTAYEIIRYQLLALMEEPVSVRLNITAANYIMNRCYLSRSGIMRILSELRDTGFIRMERGVLLEVIRLPKKY